MSLGLSIGYHFVFYAFFLGFWTWALYQVVQIHLEYELVSICRSTDFVILSHTNTMSAFVLICMGVEIVYVFVKNWSSSLNNWPCLSKPCTEVRLKKKLSSSMRLHARIAERGNCLYWYFFHDFNLKMSPTNLGENTHMQHFTLQSLELLYFNTFWLFVR